MKLEFGNNFLYQRYQEKREKLPLFYCFNPFNYDYLEGGVHLRKTIDKGFYRCEDMGGARMKIYDTYIGIEMWEGTFAAHFKKPSKLRLFLYKHFIWL